MCLFVVLFFPDFFRKVEQGLQTGVPLDPTSVAQSSQYHFIQKKPDYHSLLRRQRPLLNTMSMIVCWQSDIYAVKKRLIDIQKNTNDF